MTALFLKVLTMSLSASWLILGVMLFRTILKKAPKWVILLLWGMAALRLVCPITLESPLSLLPEQVGSGQLVQDWADDYLGSIDIYHSGSAGYDAALEAGRKPVYAGEDGYYAVTKQGQLTEPDTVENTLVPILSALWLAGAGGMLLFAAVSWFRLRRQTAPSLWMPQGFYLCDEIPTPFILGVVRPKIYIPSGTQKAQLPYILAHEEAHLSRGDHWWKLLGYLVLAAHWFNPLVWAAYLLFCRDIELACDERVVRGLDRQEAIAYSRALLDCSLNRRTVLACPLAFGEVGVKERVERVLNCQKPKAWAVAGALAGAIALGVFFLTSPRSFPLRLDALEIVQASTLDLRSSAGPVTQQLSPNELDELASRLKSLKVGPKDQDLLGFNPFYYMYIDTKEEGEFTFVGFDREGRNTALLYEGICYRITDPDFTAYLARFCGGGTRTEAVQTTSLEEAIHEAIMAQNQNRYAKGVFACESHAVLASEEKVAADAIAPQGTEAAVSIGPAQTESLTVYLMAVYNEYSFTLDDEGIERVSGGCSPAVLTFHKTAEGYTLTEYWEPGLGAGYLKDIRARFPQSVQEQLLDDSLPQALEEETHQKALEAAAQQGDFRTLAGRLLEEICAGPAGSSAPGAYIQAHRPQYDQLLTYGETTLRYCFSQFLAGGQTDLRGQVMALLCQDLLFRMGESTAWKWSGGSGQDWFDTFHEDAKALAADYPLEELEKYYPCSRILLDMIVRD